MVPLGALHARGGVPGRPRELRAGGVAALGLWGVHAADLLGRGEPWDLLWLCNVGGLVLALGLLGRAPRWVAVAASWLWLGVPLWALDLLGGGELRASSVVSHVGGLGLATLAVARVGWPRWTCVPASLGLVALVLVTRAVAPGAANVNLTARIWPGWEAWFAGYAAYLAWMGAVAAVAFAALDLTASRWVGPGGVVWGGPTRDVGSRPP